MKFLIIASIYAPYARGGAEVVVQSIAKELKKRHEVVVVTLCPWAGFSSLMPKKSCEDGVTVYRLYPLNVFSFISIASKPYVLRLAWHCIDLFSIHSFFIVRRILQNERPDCVLSHNIKGLGYTIPAAIRSTGIAWIHTMHDVQLRVPSGLIRAGRERNAHSLPNRLYALLCRCAFGSPDAVIFPSSYLKRFYAEKRFFRHSDQHVMANPLARDCADGAFEAAAHSRVREDESVRFVFVGQLEEHKGVRLLLDAFSDVCDGAARLTIAGNGSLSAVVAESAVRDSRISYLGYVPNANIRALFSKAHFSVVPALCYENSPNTIAESMSRGTPVIAANIGGCAESVRAGETGIVIPANDREALGGAFVQAMQWARSERFSAASRACIDSVSTRSVSAYVERLEGMFLGRLSNEKSR